jgi:glucose-6-phosphate dehydrogenase assembly protein OpcA
MTIDLTDTTTGAIYETLTEARSRLGGAALGMVLSLIVETDEAAQYDAMRAANQAAREHPCRVLGVITRRPNAESRLDAEIRVGEGSPGETVLLRMYGPLAQRRVTDTASEDQAQHLLGTLARSYKPGDTDFSWTRLTPWRTLLAATFDVPHPPVVRAEVLAEAGNPSGDILAAWLSIRIGIPVHRGVSGGPGITDVKFDTERGQIGISRHDGRTATLSRTGEPDRRVALHRRDQAELLAEELRRLDPDDVYAESLEWLFSDEREEREGGSFTLAAPSTAQIAANQAAERAAVGYPLDEPAAGNEPSPEDADAAATEAMNADEGETGVEAEQEIQQS